MERNICAAIGDQSVLEFLYKGTSRSVEPHTLGYNGKGILTLCAWQLTGGSGEDWRDFHLNGISELRVTDRKFIRARPGYNPNDTTMTRVLCRL